MAGYAYFVLFFAVSGFVFYATNIQGGYSSMTGYYRVMRYMCIIVLPLLTGRIFAEDRKHKLDQLIFTAPVSNTEIVTGKFFGAAGVFLAGVAVTLIYPLILSRYGNVPVGETITLYLGFILLGLMYLSIGTFISSLTENTIVAVIITYAVLVALSMVVTLVNLVPNESLIQLVMMIAPERRFDAFSMGQIDITDVVYYLSLTALFLFFTAQTFERRRLGGI